MHIRKSISSLLLMGLMAAGPASVFADQSGSNSTPIRPGVTDEIWRKATESGTDLYKKFNGRSVVVLVIDGDRSNGIVIGLKETQTSDSTITLDGAFFYDENGNASTECFKGTITMQNKISPKLLKDTKAEDVLHKYITTDMEKTQC